MLTIVFAAFVIVRVVVSWGELPHSIHGAQRLSVACDTAPKLALVLSHENEVEFDFSRTPRSLDEPDVEVLVAADRAENFKDELRSNDIEFRVLAEDASQVPREEGTRYKRSINFTSYPRYSEIKEYLRAMALKYPFVEYKELGRSFENRKIIGLKLSNGTDEKPAVLIDAGIHGREWIAPITALYAINQLTENPSNYYLFQKVDIYVVPLVNPDGYEFSRTKKSPHWRKNRAVNGKSECRGVDLNSNFGFKWKIAGASSQPCSGSYAGSRPFSEPESRAVRDFILARRHRIVVYLTLHSYGQYLLHPWGFSEGLPRNGTVLRSLGEMAAAELKKVRGTVYKVDSTARLVHPASGCSDDWAMGSAGIPIVFRFKLPPSPGSEDFVPHTDQIEPIGRETFEAFKIFIGYAAGDLELPVDDEYNSWVVISIFVCCIVVTCGLVISPYLMFRRELRLSEEIAPL